MSQLSGPTYPEWQEEDFACFICSARVEGDKGSGPEICVDCDKPICEAHAFNVAGDGWYAGCCLHCFAERGIRQGARVTPIYERAWKQGEFVREQVAMEALIA